jgi:hypothetical protein
VGIALQRIGDLALGQRAGLQAPQDLVDAHVEGPQRVGAAAAERLVDGGHAQSSAALQPVVDQQVGIEVADKRSEVLFGGQAPAHVRDQARVIIQVGRRVDVVADFMRQNFAAKALKLAEPDQL